ncbi:MAG: hypothetical protein V1778_02945 [bacterium]
MRTYKKFQKSAYQRLQKRERRKTANGGARELLLSPILRFAEHLSRTIMASLLLPTYAEQTTQASFVELAEKDESGRFLESYAQHIDIYRTAIAAYSATAAFFGILVISAIGASILL